MSKSLNLLIVEDSEDDALLLLRELRRGGYDPVSERVETPEAMKRALETRQWDIIIADYVLPKFTGLDALSLLRESGLDLPFIIVSGNIGEDIAVGAMKAGAHDYIIKGNLARLVPAVERELREAEGRHASKRVEEERVRLAAATETAADAVVITDIGGIVQYVNAAFVKMTGYAKDETLGRDLHMLDSDKQDADFYRTLRETLKRDGVWSGRLMNKTKGGTHYYEDCTYSVIKNAGGEIINYVSIKRDVTEKLRLESIAESVNTMNNIGYVFSGVRHEIGNPINSAKMSLSVLQLKLDDVSKDVVRNYVERALYEIGRVEQLLKSLRNYNLFERPELIDLELGAFMNKLIPLIAEDFERKGITITHDAGSGAVWALADPRALQQVVLNIMTNAADALSGRNNPLIAITVMKERERALIRITDNGIGMTEKQHQDLFKPFYTSKAHGTGLGLVIVKKMLTMIEGHIDITSIHKQGTTVDIDLPEGRDDAGK